MSSTNLDAPSPKLKLATIAVVVGLHVLTAVALASVKTPEMKVEPEKVTPPIEIELITPPPPPPPVEIEEIKIEEKPKPVEKLDTKLKAKPVTAPVVKKSKKSVKDPSINKPPVESPSNNNPPDELPPESTNNTTDSSQQKNLGGVVDNSTTTVVQVETNLGKKPTIDTSANNNTGSNSPSSTGAGKQNTGGNNGGNRKETTPAVDTGPVSLGVGEASWRSGGEPRLGFLANERSLIEKGSISVTAAITVDEKGNITNASISPSTGNRKIDIKIERAIKKAKLKPFIRNGVAVRGTVSLPIRYDLP